MIGLPTETMEDIDGIIVLAKKIRANCQERVYHPEHQHLCAEAIYPIPVASHGPFERGQGKAEDDQERAYRGKGREGVHDVPKYAYMQGLFALGSRSIGDADRKDCFG